MVKGERFNSISHMVGACLALIGATVLITLAAVDNEPLKVASLIVYGLSLFLLYLSSTLYHSLAGRAKAVFQKLDHGAIFLLIAGTYTPFALVALEGQAGWVLFVLVWSIAIVGIVIDNLPIPGPRVIPVVLYLVMGWLVMFFFEALAASLSTSELAWLIAGGVLYTLGVIFFILDNWYPWSHGVWHLFVLGGSGSHFVSIATL